MMIMRPPQQGQRAPGAADGVGVGRFDGINGNYWQREQLAGARDVVGALAAGEQAIVADFAETRSTSGASQGYGL